MKFRVILENPGGELANEEVVIEQSDIEGADVDDAVDKAAAEVIDGFVLSVGDVIRIVEVEA